MPVRSKVTRLPASIKKWFDKTLVENNFSGYESLSAELAERGYSISKSSLGRYGQDFEERLSKLKIASEQAKALVDAAPDDDNAVNDALMRMIQNQLLDLLLVEDGKYDVHKLTLSISRLSRASVAQKKFSAEQRKEAKEEARKELLEEQRKKLAAMGNKGGVTADTKKAIREALGIV